MAFKVVVSNAGRWVIEDVGLLDVDAQSKPRICLMEGSQDLSEVVFLHHCYTVIVSILKPQDAADGCLGLALEAEKLSVHTVGDLDSRWKEWVLSHRLVSHQM